MSKKNTVKKVTVTDELERKWLIEKIPVHPFDQVIRIKQGYLPLHPGTFRLRHEDDGSGLRYFLQAKNKGSGLKRRESSVELTEEVFSWWWAPIINEWLEKTRRVYKDKQGNKLEFDEFHGKLDGLFMLECEFVNLQQAKEFVVPDWVEVICEVTDDKDYSCKSLARHGAPEG